MEGDGDGRPGQGPLGRSDRRVEGPGVLAAAGGDGVGEVGGPAEEGVGVGLDERGPPAYSKVLGPLAERADVGPVGREGVGRAAGDGIAEGGVPVGGPSADDQPVLVEDPGRGAG